MQSVDKVLQRINVIEKKFNSSNNSYGQVNSFSAVLAEVQKKNPGDDSVYGNSMASEDIGRIIQSTAEKYGVDTKLAMAVAKVESNLVPDAVSSAGAVGVMQLMPETARGLGVRNSKDPKDNIDGGVRYLKELMNTFSGDVTKVIAAYNTGPQAVKSYNGTPPYPETREYVAKVLAQYK